MGLFIVTYDLREGQDYKPLIDELERLEGVETQRSVWFIDLNNTTNEVLDHFESFCPSSDDKLLVVKFTDKPRYTKAIKGTNAWVDARFPK